MIKGVGTITLINDGLNVDACVSEFQLARSLNTYGYDYINSSEKLLVPNVDNFDIEKSEWTLTLSLASLPLSTLFGGAELTATAQAIPITTVYRGTSILIAGATSAQVYADGVLLTQVSTPPGPGEFRLINETIDFNVDLINKVVYILAIYPTEVASTFTIVNSTFAFYGLIYAVSDEAYVVHAEDVQLSSFSALTPGDQSVTLNILNEPKIYKL